jgi:catechol 2,3-dioxygenase-like lactoylglutathione lyase family enzyme
MTVFKNARPILFVRDVTASAAFFRDKLGFTVDLLYGTPPFYAAVSRGGASLRLRFTRESVFSEAAEREGPPIVATIEVDDAAALCADLLARGVELARAPIKQDWGGTDFLVREPGGNAVSFVSFS